MKTEQLREQLLQPIKREVNRDLLQDLLTILETVVQGSRSNVSRLHNQEEVEFFSQYPDNVHDCDLKRTGFQKQRLHQKVMISNFLVSMPEGLTEGTRNQKWVQ